MAVCLAGAAYAVEAAKPSPDLSMIQQSPSSPVALVVLETEPMTPLMTGFAQIPAELSRIELKRADGASTMATLFGMNFGPQDSRHEALVGQLEPGRYILSAAWVRIGQSEGEVFLCDQFMFDADQGEAIYVGHYELNNGFNELPDNFDRAIEDIQSLPGVMTMLARRPLVDRLKIMTITELLNAKCQ